MLIRTKVFNDLFSNRQAGLVFESATGCRFELAFLKRDQ